jgi:hypothetical protein
MLYLQNPLVQKEYYRDLWRESEDERWAREIRLAREEMPFDDGSATGGLGRRLLVWGALGVSAAMHWLHVGWI